MLLYFLGMTKVKMSKEEAGSADFVEKRRAALERSVTVFDTSRLTLYVAQGSADTQRILICFSHFIYINE